MIGVSPSCDRDFKIVFGDEFDGGRNVFFVHDVDNEILRTRQEHASSNFLSFARLENFHKMEGMTG